jgi:hypothetical protein
VFARPHICRYLLFLVSAVCCRCYDEDYYDIHIQRPLDLAMTLEYSIYSEIVVSSSYIRDQCTLTHTLVRAHTDTHVKPRHATLSNTLGGQYAARTCHLTHIRARRPGFRLTPLLRSIDRDQGRGARAVMKRNGTMRQ